MKPSTLALGIALCLAADPGWAAEPIGYTAPDGVNAVPVTATTPLPTYLTSSGAPSSGAQPYIGTPLGYQQIAAATAQSSQALTVPAGATFAVIDAETGSARWRDDGTAPTTAVGNPVYAGRQLIYSGTLAAFRIIDQDANGVINISYYK